MLVARPVLFLYFVTAPYAVSKVYLTKLFLNNGLVLQQGAGFMASEKRSVLTGGMVLIALGVLIYLGKAGIYSFGKTWPVLIIVVGISTIVQRFKDFGGWFITVAGLVFLANEFSSINLSKYSQYALPAVLILLGIFILFKRRKH
jgi:hypothetical protein